MNIQRETFADDKEIENKLDDQEIIDYTFKDKIHNEKVNVISRCLLFHFCRLQQSTQG